MRPGRVPTVEGRPIEPVRHPWHRRFPPRRGPREIGLFAFLTILAWGLWIYLALPLLGLLLWWLGVERLVEEVLSVQYEHLAQTLLSYTGVFLVMISIFGLWMLWNLFCYGGTVDPDDKPPRVASPELVAAFDLAPTDLAALRNARLIHVDLDADDRVRVVEAGPARPAGQPETLSSASTRR
jgi:poly-beta-1,6-N-acetyl-D-glucosamine biosynthesis protein PgaD